MGKGQKPHARQRFLRLPNGYVVDQVPALIKDIMHDTYIYIPEVADIVIGYPVRLLIKPLVDLTGGSRVIVPHNGHTVTGVGDFYPLQPRVQKDAPSFPVRAGLAHQNLQLYPGIQQHFDLVRHDIDQ